MIRTVVFQPSPRPNLSMYSAGQEFIVIIIILAVSILCSRSGAMQKALSPLFKLAWPDETCRHPRRARAEDHPAARLKLIIGLFKSKPAASTDEA
ncbi:MAG: hypothetical protein IPK32_16795 [Verrucomicrobiaceae bacterium]|nr:hypothetical protein [Verrucomicrobiaceae bacterium]